MSIWRLFERWRMGPRQKRKYTYTLGEPLALKSTNPATQGKPYKPFPDSPADRPPGNSNSQELYRLWILLSPREQDVTALTCLRYTNPQIAARLGLSKETIRTYLEKVLNKLGLRSKADLRVIFAGWNFGEWEERHR